MYHFGRLFSLIFCAAFLFSPVLVMSQATHSTPSTLERDLYPPLPPELQVPQKLEQEQPSRFFSEFIRMLITLGTIVAFLFILSWVVRRMTNMRMMQGSTTGEIQVLDKAVISPRSTVYLLEVKGKGIAVAESNNGLVKLSEFELDHVEKE